MANRVFVEIGDELPRKTFDVMITFLKENVLASADGTLLTMHHYSSEALGEYSRIKDDALAKNRLSRMGDALGEIVLGTRDAPGPIAMAFARGVEKVRRHQVSHIRVVLDFVPDAKSVAAKSYVREGGSKRRVQPGAATSVALEELPWELMRWHGSGGDGVYVGCHPWFSVVRLRRCESVSEFDPVVRTALNIDYFNGVNPPGERSTDDEVMECVMALLGHRFPDLKRRAMTSAQASIPAININHAERIDVVAIAGHAAAAESEVTFRAFPAVPGFDPLDSGTTPVHVVAQQVAQVSGTPFLTVLMVCGDDMQQEVAVNEQDDTLGESLVRQNLPAVVSLSGAMNPSERWSILYYLVSALLQRTSLDVAVQRFRRSLFEAHAYLQSLTPAPAISLLDWYQPMLTASTLQALEVRFELRSVSDGYLQTLRHLLAEAKCYPPEIVVPEKAALSIYREFVQKTTRKEACQALPNTLVSFALRHELRSWPNQIE